MTQDIIDRVRDTAKYLIDWLERSHGSISGAVLKGMCEDDLALAEICEHQQSQLTKYREAMKRLKYFSENTPSDMSDKAICIWVYNVTQSALEGSDD